MNDDNGGFKTLRNWGGALFTAVAFGFFLAVLFNVGGSHNTAVQNPADSGAGLSANQTAPAIDSKASTPSQSQDPSAGAGDAQPNAVAPPPSSDESAPKQTATNADTDFKPSFNCSKATTNAERMICRDRRLSALDVTAAKLYKQALARASDQNAFEADQVHWREERNACADQSCLMASYNARMIELKRWLPE